MRPSIDGVALTRLALRAVNPSGLARRYRLARRIAQQMISNAAEQDEDVAQVRLVPEETFKATLHRSIDLLERNGGLRGDYLEFGVYNGTSLSCAFEVLRERGHGSARLFGFDSFRGLPWSALLEQQRVWLPGQYRCRLAVTRRALEKKGVEWSRVALVKGWFNDTLTPATTEKYQIRQASVVMVDCDIYSSAKTALEFTAPLIGDQAIIIFDDWFSLEGADQGEQKAFAEFLDAHPGLMARPVDAYNGTSLVFYVCRRDQAGTTRHAAGA